MRIDQRVAGRATTLDGPDFGLVIREQILRYGTPAEALGHGLAFRLRSIAP